MRFSKAIITGLVVNLLLVNARPIQEDVSIESGLQTTDLNSFVIRARPGKKKDPVPATPRPVTPGPATEPEGDVDTASDEHNREDRDDVEAGVVNGIKIGFKAVNVWGKTYKGPRYPSSPQDITGKKEVKTVFPGVLGVYLPIKGEPNIAELKLATGSLVETDHIWEVQWFKLFAQRLLERYELDFVVSVLFANHDPEYFFANNAGKLETQVDYSKPKYYGSVYQHSAAEWGGIKHLERLAILGQGLNSIKGTFFGLKQPAIPEKLKTQDYIDQALEVHQLHAYLIRDTVLEAFCTTADSQFAIWNKFDQGMTKATKEHADGDLPRIENLNINEPPGKQTTAAAEGEKKQRPTRPQRPQKGPPPKYVSEPDTPGAIPVPPQKETPAKDRKYSKADAVNVKAGNGDISQGPRRVAPRLTNFANVWKDLHKDNLKTLGTNMKAFMKNILKAIENAPDYKKAIEDPAVKANVEKIRDFEVTFPDMVSKKSKTLTEPAFLGTQYPAVPALKADARPHTPEAGLSSSNFQDPRTPGGGPSGSTPQDTPSRPKKLTKLHPDEKRRLKDEERQRKEAQKKPKGSKRNWLSKRGSWMWWRRCTLVG